MDARRQLPGGRAGSGCTSRRWDRDRLSDQEAVFGRSKYTGAPLGGAKEFDTPDFTATEAGTASR